jgi:DNA primase
MSKVVTPEMVRERLEAAFYTLDIPAEIERHTSTRFHSVARGKQYGGACPFEDCSVDSDGFMVWPALTPRGKHYYCRGCKRSGNILDLMQDIKGLGFSDACRELGIQNPYHDGDSTGFTSAQVKRRTPKAEQWQLDELAYLNSIYLRTKLALQRDRARAYMDERGLPFELAVEHGLGYIPALSEVSLVTPELERFRRWCDRIIFPILTPKGEIGYCGRSLFLWEPGMDEDEHKKRIDAYNVQMKEQYGDKALWHQMPRWKYTYQQGFFNWQAVKEFDTLVFVEGAFDALACMASGIPNAIPIGTTGLDAGILPLNVCGAIMGLDIDGPGRKAAKQLATSLKRKGIDVSVCMATDSKDWSAAYRMYGEQGLTPIKQIIEAQISFCYDCLDIGKETLAYHEVDEVMYCEDHYLLRVPVSAVVLVTGYGMTQ